MVLSSQALGDGAASHKRKVLKVFDFIEKSTLSESSTALKYWLIGWLLGSTICVIAQPFGASSIGILASIPYWFGVNGIATMIMFGVLRVFNGPNYDRYLLEALLGSFVFTLIFTPILTMINKAVFEIEMGLQWFVTNFAIALLIFGIVWTTMSWRLVASTNEASFSKNRLNKFKTAQLWAVSAQDHYLQVVTDQGSELILMRFGDALMELKEHDGIKIHRSHWIARQGVSKQNSSRVELRNGLSLPISRGNVAAVRAYFSEDLPMNR